MELVHKVRNLECIKLAAILFGLKMVDAVLTSVMASQGGYELNPLTRIILGQPAAIFWTYQVGKTLALIAAFLFLARVYPRQMGKVFIIIVIVVAGVCLFNLVGLIGLL